MKLFFYPRGTKGPREVWGFVPDNWLATRAVNDLWYSGDVARCAIPFDLPASPQPVGGPDYDGDHLIHAFSVRLEVDRMGGMPSNRYPCYVLIDGAKALAAHSKVATYPEARRWADEQRG